MSGMGCAHTRGNMKDTFKITLAAILGLLVVAAVAIFFQGLDFGLFKTFAPKYEQVRRDTFEQSQAYNEGMRRDLENLRDQYLAASDPASKAALRATFIHRAEGYPNQLPADLESFYQSLRG
jgi:hypothetical protein